jgi:hypothetical protein
MAITPFLWKHLPSQNPLGKSWAKFSAAVGVVTPGVLPSSEDRSM